MPSREAGRRPAAHMPPARSAYARDAQPLLRADPRGTPRGHHRGRRASEERPEGSAEHESVTNSSILDSLSPFRIRSAPTSIEVRCGNRASPSVGGTHIPEGVGSR